MSESIHQQAIIMSLKNMFDQAEKEGLWFYHDSAEVPELWASPEYLRYMQSKGRMVWAPEHWELRDPVVYLRVLHREAVIKVNEYNDLAKRLQFPEIKVEELIMGVPDGHDSLIDEEEQGQAVGQL